MIQQIFTTHVRGVTAVRVQNGHRPTRPNLTMERLVSLIPLPMTVAFILL